MTGAEKSEIKDYQALKKRNMVVLALLGIILMMAMLFSLRAGSSDLSMGDIVKAIGGQSTKQNNMVMWNIRLPRILTAVLSGVGLGVTGAVLQGILKNPLADTTTLGISQGAGFGAAFAIIVLGAGVQGSSAANMSFNNPYLITICAFGGSISASVMILVLSRFRRITPEAMVLCGVALSAMFSGPLSIWGARDGKRCGSSPWWWSSHWFIFCLTDGITTPWRAGNRQPPAWVSMWHGPGLSTCWSVP